MIQLIIIVILIVSNLVFLFLLKESNKYVDELRDTIRPLKEKIKKLESENDKISRERASILTETEKLKSIMGGFPAALIIERNEKEILRLNEEIIRKEKEIEEKEWAKRSSEIDRLFDRVLGGS